jgi:hypothetical protein
MSKIKEVPKLDWEEEWRKAKAEARRHRYQPSGARSFSDVLEQNGIEGIATAYPPIKGIYTVDIWLFATPLESKLQRVIKEIVKVLNPPPVKPITSFGEIVILPNPPVVFRCHFPNWR